MFYHPSSKKIKNTNPIIFVHGTGMDHTVWTLPVRHFLRKKKDVLAIDLPGHGNNKDKAISSIPNIANYIFTFLDKNSISNFSIVARY